MAKTPVVESFLESHNMDYLFLLLANLEVRRLDDLPYSVKSKFPKKISEIAVENVAKNDIPDFIIEQEVSRMPLEDDDEEGLSDI